jgi:hypothetical protein
VVSRRKRLATLSLSPPSIRHAQKLPGHAFSALAVAASPACPGEAPGEDQVPTAPDKQTLGRLRRARQGLVREPESTAKSGGEFGNSGDKNRCAAASVGCG